MNDKVEIQIYKRRLVVEAEGITQMEVVELAREIEEKMQAIEKKYGIPDSSKLGILTALELAAELKRVKEAHAVAIAAAEKRITEIAFQLKTGLGA
jgi:cell division protein ZapA (FtsZ GTPase activity inhibitor)